MNNSELRDSAASPCPVETAVCLKIEEATLRFGGVIALDGVSLQIARGAICGLIGPNGAGKTTLFNSVTRLYSLTSGSVTFEGQSVSALRPRQVIAKGIARTFQNLGLYQGMTVLENVLMGAHHRTKNRIIGSLLNPIGARKEEQLHRAEGEAILQMLGLAALKDSAASSLSYGTLKRVEIARALMSKPRLLLLDEPAGGLTHGEVNEFGGLLKSLRDSMALTIVLVEHHMGLVSAVCDRVIALNLGRKLAEGTPREVQENPDVVRAYLGGAAA